MTFQTAVAPRIASGVVGELYAHGPLRAAPYTLESADAANNVIGRAFTVVEEGIAQAGGVGAFAGILIAPKSYASAGSVAGGSLAPTLTLRNGEIGELATMAIAFVELATAAAIGDAVKYNTTTGVLSAGAPGAGEAAVPGAVVSHFDIDAPGIAVITLTN